MPGIEDAIVNAGGDLRAIGSHAERPWKIAVRSPGGGVIGSEYAAIFSLLDIDVTLVNRTNHLLGFVDESIVAGETTTLNVSLTL